MNTFVLIIGWLCVAAFCLGLCALAVIAAAESCRKMLDKYGDLAQREARDRLANDIQSCSWWFSEAPDVTIALRLLSENINRTGGCNVDTWRQQWRKEREQKVTKAA